MKKFITIIIVLLTAQILSAQEEVFKDSLKMSPAAESLMDMPLAVPGMNFLLDDRIEGPESPEKLALRMNLMAQANLTNSVKNNLDFYKVKRLPRALEIALIIARLFLSAPNAVPYGYYPMLSTSNPFVIAKIPGMAPEPDADRYSPSYFPQTVTAEFDNASGTYIQKAVDWNEYLNKVSSRQPDFQSTASVPKVAVTPVERNMH